MLYDFNAARLLLGSLIIRPSLALDDRYPLEKQDFSEQIFHLRLYQAILALAKKGAARIDVIDLYGLCKNNKAVEDLFKANDLSGFIDTVKQLANIDNYAVYWEAVRKCSLIRAYKENGFDTSRFEDEPEKYSIDEISNYYDGLVSSINKRFDINLSREEYVAGSDFEKTKEQLKNSPMYGHSFQSPYLNSIYRGIYGLILRAGKSGGGKTVLGIGDVCKVCCLEYWDYQEKKFVPNKSAVGPCLFINTEMDMRNEIDPIIIAWISGVSRSHILDGYYVDDEEERVDYANEVLKKSGLYIIDDPCFTTKSLVSTIKEYVTLKQIKLVCFDYIQNNGFVASEIAGETKIPQREDMILLALTDKLKQVQHQTGISILTAVQTNGAEDNMSYPTESVLAGSKGQVRKTDGTMVVLPPKDDEIRIFEMAKENSNLGIPPDAKCNLVTHIIKGRNNKFPRHLKIYQYVDYGTARSVDWFATDKDGNQIPNLKKLTISVDGRKYL